MAIPITIDDLINSQIVESTRIEFKADFNPSPIIRTICAFANDIDNVGGGYIIIGIEEENGIPKFPIKGIQKTKIDSILKKLREYCHYIEPLYEPVVEPVIYHDKTDKKNKNLVMIWITGGYGRPYKAPKDVLSKEIYKYYYIRKFSSSQIASSDEEKELFYVSSNIPFDDRENLLASVEDLDLNLIKNHLKQINSDLYNYSDTRNMLTLAKDLKIVSGPQENLKPLNVGILMFSADPQKYFRYARIEIVDIPDPTGTNMIEKVFTGPIQIQLSEALQYIKNYVLAEKVIKYEDKAEAERIYNYPYVAVEEILSNAVYHKSYQINEPITVRITQTEMEITSFPGFDRSITDEDIERYNIRAKIYRNRRIGDFLKELHLIEGRNTGFPNAMKALQKNGSKPLQFKMNPERDYLSVTILKHESFLPSGIEEKKAFQNKILSVLGKKEDAKTLTEISNALNYKSISKKLSDTVHEMEINNIILKTVIGSSIKYYNK